MLQTGDTIRIGDNPNIFGNYFKGFTTFLFERKMQWGIDNMAFLILQRTTADFDGLIPRVYIYELNNYSRARTLLIEKEFSFVFL